MLKDVSLALAALVGLRAWPRKAEPGVFAGLFLQDGHAVQVPRGYYDPATQLYHDSRTGRPMFLAQAEEGQEPPPDKKAAAKKAASDKTTASDKKAVEKDSPSPEKTILKEEDLAELLESGRFVDVSQQQVLAGAWCTMSALTTLSVTKCCPIITDSERDTECDDTPPDPPK